MRPVVAPPPPTHVARLRGRPSEIAAAAGSSLPALRCAAATVTSDAALLARLAGDPDPWVRCAVAGNPHRPVEVLAALASDPAVEVRVRVAGEAATPPEALVSLISDPAASVAAATARRSDLPEEALAAVRAAPAAWALRLAETPRLSEPVQLALAAHSASEVRAALLERGAVLVSVIRAVWDTHRGTPGGPMDQLVASLLLQRQNVPADVVAQFPARMVCERRPELFDAHFADLPEPVARLAAGLAPTFAGSLAELTDAAAAVLAQPA